MGKPTGFMDYEREERAKPFPKERIKHFNEFHIPLVKRRTGAAGCKMYGLRSAVLPVRHD